MTFGLGYDRPPLAFVRKMVEEMHQYVESLSSEQSRRPSRSRGVKCIVRNNLPDPPLRFWRNSRNRIPGRLGPPRNGRPCHGTQGRLWGIDMLPPVWRDVGGC